MSDPFKIDITHQEICEAIARGDGLAGFSYRKPDNPTIAKEADAVLALLQSKNMVLGQCSQCEESRTETIHALSEVCELRDELLKEQGRGEALYRQYEQVEAMFHNQRRINGRQNLEIALALIEKLKEPRYSDTGAPEPSAGGTEP